MVVRWRRLGLEGLCRWVISDGHWIWLARSMLIGSDGPDGFHPAPVDHFFGTLAVGLFTS